MFTDPPLARVGLSESEARRIGLAVRIAYLPVAAVLRTRATSETRGFMKAVVEVDGERILGFTMIGPEAGEVMAVVQTAMLAHLPYTGLRDAILAPDNGGRARLIVFQCAERMSPLERPSVIFVGDARENVRLPKFTDSVLIGGKMIMLGVYLFVS
jgi:hypothetical protein